MDYQTSIILDTRRAKNGEKYPVKLRVYSSKHQIKKLYATKYDLTEKEFESIILSTKPRKEHKDKRNEILAIEARADDVCKALKRFSFLEFEKRYLQKAGDNTNVIYHYVQAIALLKSNDRISTASTYNLSLKSLLAFVKHSKGSEPKSISFDSITDDWLQKYENHMPLNLETQKIAKFMLKEKRQRITIYFRLATMA